MFADIHLGVTYQQRPDPNPPPPADADGTEAQEPESGQAKVIGSMRRRKAIPPAAFQQVAEMPLQVLVETGPQPLDHGLQDARAPVIGNGKSDQCTGKEQQRFVPAVLNDVDQYKKI